MEALRSRKSCRSFRSEPPEEGQLKTVLEAAMAAPVGMAQYDKLRLIVVRDTALLERISAEAATAAGMPERRPLYGAPVVIFVCAPAGAEGAVAGIDQQNAACLVENMLLAATALGLGSVYIKGCLDYVCRTPAILESLGVPQGMLPTAAAALGHGTEPIARREIPPNRIAVSYVG